MIIWLNPLKWLVALLHWIRGGRLMEPVPTKAIEATMSRPNPHPHQEPVPARWPEQVLRNTDTMEPVLILETGASDTRRGMRLLEPGPLVHAQALLSMLQRRYPPGAVLEAWDVENECYPLLLREKGWRPRPWGSREGVGKYLATLPGVEKFSPYIEAEDGFKDRIRCYRLPLADSEPDSAELAKRAA